MMSKTETIEELVGRMPDPDFRGMYTENIDKDKIDDAVVAILDQGEAGMTGMIAMLGEPGSVEDSKPRYALHCVLNLTLIQKDDAMRRKLCLVLADSLSKDLSLDVKAYLCQELQWAGRSESVGALASLLTDETLCDPAAMALVAIGDAAPFRAALPQAEGRSRLTIIHSLAALNDMESVNVFKSALADVERDVRIAAGAGLASTGGADDEAALLDALNNASGYEAVQAKKHCLILADRLKKSDVVRNEPA